MTSVIVKCKKCGKDFERGIYPIQKCDICSILESSVVYTYQKIKRGNF